METHIITLHYMYSTYSRTRKSWRSFSRYS